jgi:hypothetical protein
VHHKVAETDLAAALLMDAINRKVPLPTESNKRLYMIADHLALVIDQRQVSGDPGRATRLARRRGIGMPPS